MNLAEVRQEINHIDGNMKSLFDDRMQCSSQVAEVKIAGGDCVYKPDRELEICERYADDRAYLAFVKKIMQISRKFQYSMFLDRDIVDVDFAGFMGDNATVFKEGGSLKLTLIADKNAVSGLNVKDIISIIADTCLELVDLSVDESGIVKVTLSVDNDQRAKREAYILSYMLYMETLESETN